MGARAGAGEHGKHSASTSVLRVNLLVRVECARSLCGALHHVHGAVFGYVAETFEVLCECSVLYLVCGQFATRGAEYVHPVLRRNAKSKE